jgi:short-subunit dehydrogenase
MYRNNRAVQRIVSLLILLQATISTGAMSILSGKRVLVTGAGRGIGRAIANICAGEGAKVAICSRTKAELEETMAELEATTQSSNMGMYIVDLKEQEQVDRMVSSIVDEFGGIDILINNAGGSQAGKGPAYELPTSDLKDILDLNIVSVHSVTSSVLQKTMLKNGSGRIINISSKAGKVGFPNMSFYCASKFALEGYSATIAEELKDKHIIVNTISPGMVNTSSFPKAKGKKGVRTAESVKDALLLLLTTEKTGHYVHVDELDEVKGRGLDDDMALKPINEAPFSV